MADIPRTPRTPRLPSAFPQTPRTLKTPRRQNGGLSQPRSTVKGVATFSRNDNTQGVGGPLISFDVIDAPSQRLYLLAFYAALHAWRIYESWSSSDAVATWLFLKWVTIDGVFLFGLPALRIPWLEWAFPTTLAALMIHTVLNAFLMFQIPVRCRLSNVFDVLEDRHADDYSVDTGWHLASCPAQSGV